MVSRKVSCGLSYHCNSLVCLCVRVLTSVTKIITIETYNPARRDFL